MIVDSVKLLLIIRKKLQKVIISSVRTSKSVDVYSEMNYLSFDKLFTYLDDTAVTWSYECGVLSFCKGIKIGM